MKLIYQRPIFSLSPTRWHTSSVPHRLCGRDPAEVELLPFGWICHLWSLDLGKPGKEDRPGVGLRPLRWLCQTRTRLQWPVPPRSETAAQECHDCSFTRSCKNHKHPTRVKWPFFWPMHHHRKCCNKRRSIAETTKSSYSWKRFFWPAKRI